MKSQKSAQSPFSGVVNDRVCLAALVGAAGLALSVQNSQAQQWPDRSLYLPPLQTKPIRKPVRTEPSEVSPSTQPVLVEPSGVVVATPDDSAMLTRIRRNEVSFSTDFMFGQGEVSVPIGYSVQESLGGAGKGLAVQGRLADRESFYYGGTLSYSYNQDWYIDFSYSQGESSGNKPFPAFQSLDGTSDFKTDFTIDDQWYQGYVRYDFGRLKKYPFHFYVRGGVTYVTADLEVKSVGSGAGRYSQEDSTQDILGNLGFGVRYVPYDKGAVTMGINLEGEGFFGFRTQETKETLTASEDLAVKTATIDNTLYGGIGRLTGRFEYTFGQDRQFRAFAEAGLQARFTIVDYPDAGSEQELLWGPYVKVGFLYRF